MPQSAKRSRITIGDTTVTYLPDGFGAHNPDVLFPGVDWTTHPGHLQDGQLVLDSSGASTESVCIVGDILHSLAQVGDPALVFSSDVAPDQARAVRDRVLARPDTVIAAGHLTDDVFGRVASVGDAYAWAPVGGPPSAR
ncbi:hypothetical protein [Streptomyces sp. NPDC001820]|uniref:hypothetical protein n=1 Tax=Streptomyces sp. NPDC001820 TaxID=3364613 RepID=UPI00369FB5CF